MTLGQKFRAIREAQGLSLEEVGDRVGYNHSTISRVENDRDDLVDEKVPAIRVALGIDTVPFFDHERESFRTRLRIFDGHLDKREMEEAKKMWERLAAIKLITWEHEFNALYDLFSFKLLMREGKLEEANAIFEKVKTCLDNVGNEVLFHYYHIQGILNVRLELYENAFDFYMKALEVWKDSYGYGRALHYNTAYCAAKLGRIAYAIVFYRKTRKEQPDNEITIPNWAVDMWIAINYIYLGLFEDSKKLMYKCLKDAKKRDDSWQINNAYSNISYFYWKVGDYQTALSYIDDAVSGAREKKEDDIYISALFGKARLLFYIGNITGCIELMAEGKKLAKDNEEYTMRFKALEHMLTIDSRTSLDYLETITIPYFLRTYQIMLALEYCEFVKEYYEKKKQSDTKKALKISALIADICMIMHGRGEQK